MVGNADAVACRRPAGRHRWPSVRALVATVLLVAGCASGPASAPPSPTLPVLDLSTSGATGSASTSAVPGAPSASAAASARASGPVTVGSLPASLVLLGRDGVVSILDTSGHGVPLGTDDLTAAFPSFAPDGSRVAAVRTKGPESTIVVYDVAATGPLARPPTVIFQSTTEHPFYLAWTPDGHAVSFLSQGPDVLSLRVARADGTGPVDGSGPGAIVRQGSPLYFDWIGPDRLLAHVGSGADAFLGELAPDGSPAAAPLAGPGAFRTPVASVDGTYVAYQKATPSGDLAIVTSRRDGSSEYGVPSFGASAVVFDPSGSDVVATIGPDAAPTSQAAIPIGPIRLLDAATGKVRTLLDGTVLSCWWSPDGTTIAALRVQPVATPDASDVVATSGGPVASASQATNEARLLFVDVETGTIRSQAVVRPGQLYIDQYLTYFDQYATSHAEWAPDSSRFVMPIIDDTETTRVAVIDPDGGRPVGLDGLMAFWSPT